MEICSSYPYIEDGVGKSGRKYLLFYKWVHWIFLIMAGIYYIPYKLAKNCGNSKVDKIIQDLSQHHNNYSQNELMGKVKSYVDISFNTHNNLYYGFLICNIAALIIDIAGFFFLDFMLQGRFTNYGWEAYPYRRDPVRFKDYISMTFPPFVKCQLTPTNKLIASRTENIACHLTMMELYDKLFLIIWIWIILLFIITVTYILIFLFLSLISNFSLIVIRVSKPHNVTTECKIKNMNVLLRCCKIGDIYLFYCLRQCLSHKQFYELLRHLLDSHSNCTKTKFF